MAVARRGDIDRTPEDVDRAAVAWAFVGPGSYDPYVAHPAYGDCARQTFGNWAFRVREFERIERALPDLAHWVAAESAVVLAAEPAGLTAATLEQLLRSLDLASRGRGGLILAYLQYRRLIQPAPDLAKGRDRRFEPTAELTAFMRLRYRRDLEVMTPLDPTAGLVLAAWERPGLFERFMAAGRPLSVCSIRYKRPREVSLEPIIERNGGLAILGQLLLSDDDGGVFPRRDGVRLNILDIARRSGAPRHQVMHILKVARAKGFILDLADGLVLFAPGLIERVERTLGSYWRGLVWRAREALG
jgi:hypothetical protein